MRRTGSSRRKRRPPDSSGQGYRDNAQPVTPRTIEIEPQTSVRQLADALEVSAIDVIKQLMRNGIMATINEVVDYDLSLIHI